MGFAMRSVCVEDVPRKPVVSIAQPRTVNIIIFTIGLGIAMSIFASISMIMILSDFDSRSRCSLSAVSINEACLSQRYHIPA